MNYEISDHQDELMRHTAGLNDCSDRNWFGTSQDGRDAEAFKGLVDQGLAVGRNAPDWSGDDVIFHLTDLGIKVANKRMPPPKPTEKISRSKRRYQLYLEYGEGMTFRDFLDWAPELESNI